MALIVHDRSFLEATVYAILFGDSSDSGHPNEYFNQNYYKAIDGARPAFGAANSSSASKIDTFSGTGNKTDMRNYTVNYGHNSTGKEIVRFELSRLIIPLAILYGIIAVVGTFGNGMLILLIVCYRRLHNVTNYFIASLAFSDLVVCLSAVLVTIIDRLHPNNWPFGNFMCHFVYFVSPMSVSVSSWTLTAIAIDRYYMVQNPMRKRLPTKAWLGILIVIWSCAAIMATPTSYHTSVWDMSQFGLGAAYCVEIWENRLLMYKYNIGVIFVNYGVPVLIVITLYVRISLILGRRKPPGVLTRAQERVQDRRNRKTHFLTAMCTLTFVLSWLPINIYWMIDYFEFWLYGSRRTIDPYYQDMIFISVHCLAMTSVCYNPFLYALLHETFSRLAAHVICFWRRQTGSDRRLDFRLSLRSTFSSSLENDASVRYNSDRFRHTRSTTRRNATDDEGMKNDARPTTPAIELASFGGGGGGAASGGSGKRRDSPLEWTRATSRMQHQGIPSNVTPLVCTNFAEAEPAAVGAASSGAPTSMYRVLTTMFGGSGGDSSTPVATPQPQQQSTTLPFAKQIVAAVLSRRSSTLSSSQRLQQQQSTSLLEPSPGVGRQVPTTTEIVVEPPSPEQNSIDRCRNAMASKANHHAANEQQIRWKYPIGLKLQYSDNDDQSI